MFNVIYSCDTMLNYQHHYSSLKCHMILQKSFKYADLLLKKHLWLLSMLKTVFVENWYIIHNCILLGNDLILHIFPGVFLSLSFILCACLFLCKNLLIKGQRWSVVVKLHRFMSSDLRVSSRSVLQMRCFDFRDRMCFCLLLADRRHYLCIATFLSQGFLFVCVMRERETAGWRTGTSHGDAVVTPNDWIEFFWFLTWDSSINYVC